MNRIAKILVEGQTEEAFVKHVLGPPSLEWGLQLSAVLPPTSPGHYGGTIKFSTFLQLIKSHLHDRSQPYVSMMFDIHRLHRSWRDELGFSAGRCESTKLQEALGAKVGHSRFLPYFSSHDFEALLFADPECLCNSLGCSPRQSTELKDILANAGNPESIDHDEPPGRRLERIFPGYRKAVQGPVIAERIGIETMRSQCPGFAAWISRLKALP